MTRRPRTVADLRALHAEAQDATPAVPVPERIALTAVDELERALARNAILERTVKRLKQRLAAMEGAAQGLARRIMAFHATHPESIAIVNALNEEAAVGQAIAEAEREQKAAPYKSKRCQCGQSVQQQYGHDCDACGKRSCEGCHRDCDGKCAHCGGREVVDLS